MPMQPSETVTSSDSGATETVAAARLDGSPEEALPSVLQTEHVPVDSSPPRASAMPTAFVEGERLADRFEIVALLGQGGMGQVYEAYDHELGTAVAVKVIRPDLSGRPRVVERFRDEVQLARRVTHPNVCRIFDLFQHREEEVWGRAPRPILLLTMELLRGDTLHDLLREHGPLPLPTAVDLGRQLANGLDAAHRAGVLHRDLKTANVSLVDDGAEVDAGRGRVVITDFGLAGSRRLEQPAERDGAEDGERAAPPRARLAGTAGYVAPEVLAGAPFDARADVFSLGVVLFEMVAGRRPFVDHTLRQAAARSDWTPPRTTADGAKIPGPWNRFFERCLAADPLCRFATAGKVADALGALGHRRRKIVLSVAPIALAGLALGGWLVAGPSADRADPARISVAEGSQAPSGPPSISAARIGAPATIGVLGIEPLAPRTAGDRSADARWVALAFEEMLTSELAADGRLRALPSVEVDRMRRRLDVTDVTGLGREDLARIGADLGTDFAVAGSVFAASSDAEDGTTRVRFDLRLADTRDGRELSRVIVEGGEDELLELVAQAGRRLRQDLGLGAGTRDGAARGPVGLPTTRDALRLYVQGLASLRRMELIDATETLERAVALEPDATAALSALSAAWAERGVDGPARDAAERAVAALSGETESQRLWVDARFREADKSWNEAAALYGELVHRFPDDVEASLRLAAMRTAAGEPQRAIEALDDLRGSLGTSRPSDSGWPRVDLAEAAVHAARGDFSAQLEAADRALAGARTQGSTSMEAEALFLRAQALYSQAELDAARDAARRGVELLEARGEPLRLARAALRFYEMRVSEGFLEGTPIPSIEDTVDTLARAGDRLSEARARVFWAAKIAFEELDHERAVEQVERALRQADAFGSPLARAEALNLRATLQYLSGDARGSVARFEEALEVAEASGSSRLVAGVSMNLANILKVLGDADTARMLYDRSLEIHRRDEHLSDLAKALMTVSHFERRQNDTDAAERLALEALDLGRRLGSEEHQISAHEALAKNEQRRGRYENALVHARIVLDFVTAQGDLELVDTSSEHVVRLLNQLGRLDDADRLLAEIESRIETGTSRLPPHDRLAVAVTRAEWHLRDERPDEALSRLVAIQPALYTEQTPGLRHRVHRLVVEAEGKRLTRGSYFRGLEATGAVDPPSEVGLQARLDQVRLLRGAGRLEDALERSEALRADLEALEAEAERGVDLGFEVEWVAESARRVHDGLLRRLERAAEADRGG